MSNYFDFYFKAKYNATQPFIQNINFIPMKCIPEICEYVPEFSWFCNNCNKFIAPLKNSDYLINMCPKCKSFKILLKEKFSINLDKNYETINTSGFYVRNVWTYATMFDDPRFREKFQLSITKKS